jgi:hypothetical protein
MLGGLDRPGPPGPRRVPQQEHPLTITTRTMAVNPRDSLSAMEWASRQTPGTWPRRAQRTDS